LVLWLPKGWDYPYPLDNLVEHNTTGR
jgi:hypothetical protein